jgi:hypothetical protein
MENQTPEKADAEIGGIYRIEWPATWQENTQQRSGRDEDNRGQNHEFFPMEDLLSSWTNDNSGSYNSDPIFETDKAHTALTDRENPWIPWMDMADLTIPVAYPSKDQASNGTASNANGSSIPTASPSATAQHNFQSHSTRPERTPKLPLPDNQSPVQCDCLRLVACLLEDLGTRSTSADEVGIGALLRCCRESLGGCHKALCCPRCKSRSESTMLLAMVALGISTMYEKMARHFERLVSQGDGEGSGHRPEAIYDPVTGRRMTTNTGGQEAAEIWVNNYRIDNKAERTQVILTLITVQLGEFCQLLDQLKERAGDREVHQAPLASAQRRVRGIRSLLLPPMNHIT